MEIETIEKIFKFLEEKEGKDLPRKWVYSIRQLKFINELENHPDGVQYRYDGHLFLSDSTIKKLPNDLYVEGNLDITDTNITSLPERLEVGGYLSLIGLSITSLPKGLEVGDNLFIEDTPLVKLSDEAILNMIKPNGFVKGIIR